MATMPKPNEVMESIPNDACFPLMQHILYCSRYAKVKWGGKLWFASSHDEFAAATGLSKRKVKRSFASLRKAGLIETEQHIFAGKTVTHVRVVSAGGLPGETPDGLPGETSGGLLPILEEDQTEDQTKSARAIKGGEMESKTTEGRGSMTADVASILKSNSEKAEEKFSPKSLLVAMDEACKSPSRPRLGKVFMISWVLAGIPLRPALTSKELRQLGNIVDACEDTKVGVYLIAEMVEKWESLAASLKQSYKKSAPPELPNIGYVLAAKVNVVQWLRDQVNQDEAQTLAPENEEVWDL